MSAGIDGGTQVCQHYRRNLAVMLRKSLAPFCSALQPPRSKLWTGFTESVRENHSALLRPILKILSGIMSSTGQHRPVIVKRLVIENSIESKIIELGVKKANMVSSVLADDDQALGRLTPEDLSFLFTM